MGLGRLARIGSEIVSAAQAFHRGGRRSRTSAAEARSTAKADPGKKTATEEGTRVVVEEREENAAGTRPHSQTATLTPFLTRRPHESGWTVAAGDDIDHPTDSRALALGELEEPKQQAVSAQQSKA